VIEVRHVLDKAYKIDKIVILISNRSQSGADLLFLKAQFNVLSFLGRYGVHFQLTNDLGTAPQFAGAQYAMPTSEFDRVEQELTQK
jgi:hypothetical protein